MKVHAKGSGKLFNNKVLEAFTKTHPAIIISIYVPVCGLLLYYFYNHVVQSIATMALVFFSGFFVWTFAEYLIHRYVFHFLDERRWVQRFHYFVHGVHHEYPKDKNRLIMPPFFSLVLSSTFFIVFRLILGTYAYAFFPGFVIGYLSYAMMHYTLHMVRPPKNFLRYLWIYHNHHHYKYPNKAYGVSSPLWDMVFGTLPPNEKKQPEKVEIGR